MKKMNVCLGVLFLLTILFVSTGVFAQTSPYTSVPATSATSNAFKPLIDMMSGAVTQVIVALKPLFEFLLGDIYNNDIITTSNGLIDSNSLFFAKILLFFLLASITFSIIKMVPLFATNRWTLWIVSLVVPILGVRFLSSSFVAAILLPYSTFAVAVTAGLPFVLYFFLVNKGLSGSTHKLARRVAWILFGVVFFLMWVSRYEAIATTSQGGELAASMYLFVAVAAFVMMLLDGTIQRWFAKAKSQRLVSSTKGSQLLAFQNMLAQINTAYAGNPGWYAGTTPYGRRKTAGNAAYQADLQWVSEQIAALNV